MCVYTCIWRPDTSVFIYICLISLEQRLSLNLALTDKLGWLSGELWEATHLHLPPLNAGAKHMP